MEIACGRLLPDKVKSSKTLSITAESLPPGTITGNIFFKSLPNNWLCKRPWRLRIQLMLPLKVLISPLCAINLNGCDKSQVGKVLVE